jgi:hypothetical protein
VTSKKKFEIVPARSRELERPAFDAFYEGRVQDDLAAFGEAPGVIAKCLERTRVRFEKSGERAIVERHVEFCQTAERLLAARTALERQQSEYLNLGRDHELKETEKAANVPKHRADTEEHNFRRDKAAYQREHLEKFVEGAPSTASTVDTQAMNEASERRVLDTRWELNESLRALHTLIELQHWRRQQRDRILLDRSLSAQEQSEDLQFVDELYEQKRSELRVDTRIFGEQ